MFFVGADIWWLVWAILAIAVIERRNLMDEDKKWFDLFRVLFELVSAFGGIGLTLGVPYVSENIPHLQIRADRHSMCRTTSRSAERCGRCRSLLSSLSCAYSSP